MGLDPDSVYEFTVRAVNNLGLSRIGDVVGVLQTEQLGKYSFVNYVKKLR